MAVDDFIYIPSLLQVDICQLGTDQRKVNMLAREYADLGGKSKPIILSHRILFAWIYIHMYLCIFNLISICSLSLN